MCFGLCNAVVGTVWWCWERGIIGEQNTRERRREKAKIASKMIEKTKKPATVGDYSATYTVKIWQRLRGASHRLSIYIFFLDFKMITND